MEVHSNFDVILSKVSDAISIKKQIGSLPFVIVSMNTAPNNS